MFESDVISDGTQTFKLASNSYALFESDVISDGTQTLTVKEDGTISLRVM